VILMESTLQLFKITHDEIISAKNITPEDVILILDKENKQIYVFRGQFSLPLDEFKSATIYERIINRFLNPNILLLTTLVKKDSDSKQILQIKEFIVDHYPNPSSYKVTRIIRNTLLLRGVRDRIKTFKNYENSRVWRKKLSNTTNIWRLSAFNVLSVMSVFVILVLKLLLDINQGNFIFLKSDGTIDSNLWGLWLESLGFILGLCIFILIITFLTNLIFLLFPLRFPINPKAIKTMEQLSKSEIYEKRSTNLGPRDIKSLEKSKGELPKAPVLPPSGRKLSIDLNVPKIPKKKSGMKLQPIKLDLSNKVPVSQDPTPMDYQTSDYDDMLNIPAPPLKKKMQTPALTASIDAVGVEKLSQKDTPETKYIVIDCPICKLNLAMPIPRKLITEAKEPVVEISYVHGDPQHVLVAQLDHDFDVRRRRSSWVVFEK
jgi:hypothetical protein